MCSKFYNIKFKDRIRIGLHLYLFLNYNKLKAQTNCEETFEA
jgi:hypothetical protein